MIAEVQCNQSWPPKPRSIVALETGRLEEAGRGERERERARERRGEDRAVL